MKFKAGDSVIFVNDFSSRGFPQYRGSAKRVIGRCVRWAWGWKNPPSPTKAYERMLPPTEDALKKTDGKIVCNLTVKKGYSKVESGTNATVIEATKEKIFIPPTFPNSLYEYDWSAGHMLLLKLQDGRKLICSPSFVSKTDPANPRCVTFVSEGPRVVLYEAVINNKGNRVWKRLCFLSRKFDRGKDDRYEIMSAVEHYAKKLDLPALIVTRGTPYDEKNNETWLKVGYQPPVLDEGALITFRTAGMLSSDKSEIVFFGSKAWKGGKVSWPRPAQAELPIQPGKEQAMVLGYIDDPELGRGARLKILYQGRSYDVYRDQMRGLDE